MKLLLFSLVGDYVDKYCAYSVHIDADKHQSREHTGERHFDEAGDNPECQRWKNIEREFGYQNDEDELVLDVIQVLSASLVV